MVKRLIMAKWTEEEIHILQTYYLKFSAKECIENFGINHSVKSLQKKARELGIKKNNKWTDDEIETFKHDWQYSSMDVLIHNTANHSYSSMMCKARELGVKSIIDRSRHGSFDFLNDLNSESAYWWGFITADGCLTERGELVVGLSDKDQGHLLKLAKHLCVEKISVKENKGRYSSKNGSKICTLRLQDKGFQKKWYSILDYTSPKTYNPLKLDVFYKEEYLIYFLIGMIDGDGSIWISRCSETQKGSISLRIEINPNWENRLRELCQKVEEIYGIKFNVKKSSKGYIKAEISGQKDLFKIYEFVKKGKCDFLERKWSKVENFMSQ